MTKARSDYRILVVDDQKSMRGLATYFLKQIEFQDIDETLARIQAVTVEEVRDLARELAGAPRTITVVGPFEESETFGL